MIRKTKQDWSIGSSVKVGFLTLTVVANKETPGDFKPDAYLLVSSKNVLYVFVPHNGLTRIESREEFEKWNY